jgi:hypothetical protein
MNCICGILSRAFELDGGIEKDRWCLEVFIERSVYSHQVFPEILYISLFMISPSSFDKVSHLMSLATSTAAPASIGDKNNTYI